MEERLYYIFIAEYRSVQTAEYRRTYTDTLHYGTQLCVLPLGKYKAE